MLEQLNIKWGSLNKTYTFTDEQQDEITIKTRLANLQFNEV
jgi:hypothetical protein